MKKLEPYERILLPYDASTLSDADVRRMTLLGDRMYVGGIKVGLESQTAETDNTLPTIACRLLPLIHGARLKSMWDGKFNDIPNTVGNAFRNIASKGVWGMTVMASAGPDALKAAVANRGNALIIGVTVLTSLSEQQCKDIYRRSARSQVLYFANMLVECGAQAIVCSPLELEAVRNAIGYKLICITPGIRGKDAKPDDQNRTMTAGDAIRAGADYLVIGRPIMQATYPEVAARCIGDEILIAEANLLMI